ncbi:MAG: cupredoxin domain-containing protein [Actinomycetota bacterium]|nr:cupredoxin domain-containing protein [Actinomycetota bacterium]
MRSTVWKSVLVLVAVVLLGAACSSNSETTTGGSTGPSESGSAGGTITIGSDTANNHGSKDVSGQSSIAVEQDDFYFNPTIITGTAGQKVTIKLENEGSTTHNFSLEDQNIDQDVTQGQDATVTVTFPQSGTLEFYCKFHRASGMVGELSVS